VNKVDTSKDVNVKGMCSHFGITLSATTWSWLLIHTVSLKLFTLNTLSNTLWLAKFVCLILVLVAIKKCD